MQATLNNALLSLHLRGERWASYVHRPHASGHWKLQAAQYRGDVSNYLRQYQTGLLALLLLILMGCAMTMQRDYHRVIAQADRWAVYYGAGEPPQRFLSYDVVVFDTLAHPKLEILKTPNRILLGYLSIGEEATHNPMPIHQQAGVRLQKNTQWGAENYVLDLRSELWAADVLQNQIPAILAKGFDGIMIDTIEAPFEATKADIEANAEMKLAAMKLLRAIRKAYPEMPIMLNRGFEILPEIAPEIDMVLGESITTDYDFATGNSHFRPKQDQQYIARALEQAEKQNKTLRVFSLNYWRPEQKATIQQVYNIDREKGYVPYVATIDLARHFTEPKFEGRN